jgi:adenylyltransferase/sulfurtransferase
VLVAGAGALGNEVLKNLALLGIGHVVVVDMDCIELSNLSRSVLFRAEDTGQPKAACAARGARAIYPDLDIVPMHANLLGEVGLGVFRWADLVIGALDNREARVFINAACAKVGRPWIDGGIEVLQGIARAFNAPQHACYECTMSKVDWDLLNKRRSCSLLAARAIQQRGTPTTSTTASVIGAIQVQEAIKLLHGQTDFLGKGFFYDGARHQSYPISYSRHPGCEWRNRSRGIQAGSVTF